jgi:cytidylate kinase
MAILTISRQYGSGGRQVGLLVAARLGWELVDKDVLHRDLLARGEVWARLDMELDEVKPDLWERHDWRYHAWLSQLESAIWDHAAGGRVVIVGRGANHVLAEAPLVLSARVVAPLALRVERLMAREGIADPRRAEELATMVDRERAGYVKANYGRAWDDPGAYDLSIDTGEVSLEEAAARLAEMLAEMERRATPAERDRLAGLALAARLKARIASEPGFLLPTLVVRHEPEAIVVEAVIHRPEERAVLARLAREVCGDTPVRLALRPRL